MHPATQFLLRHATVLDIPALRSLIELSVRQLQKDDYSLAQIEGALGHALGLDTQLIEDRTYFVAEATEERCLEATRARIGRRHCWTRRPTRQRSALSLCTRSGREKVWGR
jgi:hypothetical protein